MQQSPFSKAVRALDFKPDSLEAHQRRFVEAIAYPNANLAKNHVFDFDSGLRLVACLVDSDENLLSVEGPLDPSSPLAPFLRLSFNTEGTRKYAKVYPAKPINVLEVFMNCHCFDLTNTLVPSYETKSSCYYAFYYCPDCVFNWYKEGKIPKIHFTPSRPGV